MNWLISGMSGGGLPAGVCEAQPSIEFRGRFLRHPVGYGKRFASTDEAFAFMNRLCGCEPYFRRPVAFICLRLPRSARRHLRAMSRRVMWDCIERLDWHKGASPYLRSVRVNDYQRKTRRAWERYIKTGRCSHWEECEKARKRSVFCK